MSADDQSLYEDVIKLVVEHQVERQVFSLLEGLHTVELGAFSVHQSRMGPRTTQLRLALTVRESFTMLVDRPAAWVWNLQGMQPTWVRSDLRLFFEELLPEVTEDTLTEAILNGECIGTLMQVSVEGITVRGPHGDGGRKIYLARWALKGRKQ